MREIKLSDYLEKKLGTQAQIAKYLGINQSAVSLMYRKERNIILFIDDDNKVIKAEERRIVPIKKGKAA